MTPGVFVYTHTSRGRTCSDVLNHAFFDSYRTPSLVDLATGEQQIALKYVVVSFCPTQEEPQLTLASRQGSPTGVSCRWCKSPVRCHAVEKGVTRHYCGRVCFEFGHLFGGRTVYR